MIEFLKKNKFYYYGIFSIWISAAVVAIFLPSKIAIIINKYNFIEHIWKIMSGWKGFIKSEFQEISSIYYSMVWMTYPIWVRLLLLWLNDSEKKMPEVCCKKNI